MPAPTNAYPTAVGKWILVAANSDPLFARLSRAMGRPELVDDPDFTGNQARVKNRTALDDMIGARPVPHSRRWRIRNFFA